MVVVGIRWRWFFGSCLAASLGISRAHASDAHPADAPPADGSNDDGWTTPTGVHSEEASEEPEVSSRDAEHVPPSAPRSIMVHIESNRDVELQVFESGAWLTVCHSPCDVAVLTGETYRIDAKGVRTSNAFKLDDVPGDQVVLQVDAASSSVRAVGVGAAVVGSAPVVVAGTVAIGGAAALGVVVILVCPFVAAFGGDFGGCAGELFGGGARAYWDTVSTPAVAGVLGGGVVLAITGFALMRSHDSTHVDRAPRNLAIAPLDRHGQLPLPRGATVPLLSGAF